MIKIYEISYDLQKFRQFFLNLWTFEVLGF